MQGLADGYFVLPYTIGDYLSSEIRTGKISTDTFEFKEAKLKVEAQLQRLININGSKPADYFHIKLGKIMWEYVGMSRNEEGLNKAIKEIQDLRKQFWDDLFIPGNQNSMNPELVKASRVLDFLELGELFAIDALQRNESCGGHYREESVEKEGPQKGEAKRDDENYSYVSAWEYKEDPSNAVLHREKLEFKNIEVKQRSYK